MRFIWGPIPRNDDFDPDASQWTRLSSLPAKFFAAQMLVGMIPCFIVAGYALEHAAGHLPPATSIAILLLPAPLVPIHELTHLAGYGVNWLSPRLLTGIWPSHGTWYVVYDAPLRRERVLMMLLAPFFLWTIAPLFVAATTSSIWSGALCYLASMHAALSVGDLATAWRILVQVPRGAAIRNQGWDTYWRAEPFDLPLSTTSGDP